MRVTKIIIMLLTFLSLSFGQENKINISDIDSLRKTNDMFVYVGSGQFITMRSCRMTWLKVRFGSIQMSKIDSTVSLAGCIYNNNSTFSSEVNNVQIIVGKFQEYTEDKFKRATMSIKDRFVPNSSGDFSVKFKCSPDDDICFAIEEPITDETQEVFAIEAARIEVFAIGRLFK